MGFWNLTGLETAAPPWIAYVLSTVQNLHFKVFLLNLDFSESRGEGESVWRLNGAGKRSVPLSGWRKLMSLLQPLVPPPPGKVNGMKAAGLYGDWKSWFPAGDSVAVVPFLECRVSS